MRWLATIEDKGEENSSENDTDEENFEVKGHAFGYKKLIKTVSKSLKLAFKDVVRVTMQKEKVEKEFDLYRGHARETEKKLKGEVRDEILESIKLRSGKSKLMKEMDKVRLVGRRLGEDIDQKEKGELVAVQVSQMQKELEDLKKILEGAKR